MRNFRNLQSKQQKKVNLTREVNVLSLIRTSIRKPDAYSTN